MKVISTKHSSMLIQDDINMRWYIQSLREYKWTERLKSMGLGYKNELSRIDR